MSFDTINMKEISCVCRLKNHVSTTSNDVVHRSFFDMSWIIFTCAMNIFMLDGIYFFIEFSRILAAKNDTQNAECNNLFYFQ